MTVDSQKCGQIAVIGRPNVGKSTLINALVGERVSITSRKPQTTRHQIRGILSKENAQFILVDTPGFQEQYLNALNKVMNLNVKRALRGVDVALLVIEAGEFGEADARILSQIPAKIPVVLAVNKIDRLPIADLLPFLKLVGMKERIENIVPVSAERGKNLDKLTQVLQTYLPTQAFSYDLDAITDRNERFLAAERIREKLYRQLGDEIPYGASVTIEKFEQVGNLRRISASIVVNKPGHKPILIGAGGSKLKSIATAARKEMESLFGGKVFLEVWVKVRPGWTENAAMLARLGYD